MRRAVEHGPGAVAMELAPMRERRHDLERRHRLGTFSDAAEVSAARVTTNIVRFALLSPLVDATISAGWTHSRYLTAPTFQHPVLGSVYRALPTWSLVASAETVRRSAQSVLMQPILTEFGWQDALSREMANALDTTPDKRRAVKPLDPNDTDALLGVVREFLDMGLYTGALKYFELADVNRHLLPRFGIRPDLPALETAVVHTTFLPALGNQTAHMNRILSAQTKGCETRCYGRTTLPESVHADLRRHFTTDDEFRLRHTGLLALRPDKFAVYRSRGGFDTWPAFEPMEEVDPRTGRIVRTLQLGGVYGCPAVPNHGFARLGATVARAARLTTEWRTAADDGWQRHERFEPLTGPTPKMFDLDGMAPAPSRPVGPGGSVPTVACA